MVLSTIIHELDTLFFPRTCPGCGCWDEALCVSCQHTMLGWWHDVSPSVPGIHVTVPISLRHDNDGNDSVPLFPVYSLGAYSGARKNVIISWKNVVNGPLSKEIARIVHEQGRRLGNLLASEGIDKVSIVPAPSRAKRAHVGLYVVADYAQWLAQAFNDSGIDAVYQDVLGYKKVRVVTSNKQGRRHKAQAITLRRRVDRENIVLVDDVVASGATLGGCARALHRGGAKVFCAVVLANSSF